MDSSRSLGQLINSMSRVNFNDEIASNPLFAELAKEAKLKQFRQQEPGLTEATIDDMFVEASKLWVISIKK